jgi:uncharacterized protein (DUF1499 family)
MLYAGIGALLALGVFVGLAIASWRRPELGPVSGRLRHCPASPNCVCSQQTGDDHFIEPLRSGGDPQSEFERLKSMVEALPRTKRIDQRDGYARYEFTSRLMRYVDDVEFLLDAEAGVIHVRSASRVGRSDFGANRARVEDIRRRFAAAQ